MIATKRGNWFALDNLAVNMLLPKVGANAFAVYVCLARYANKQGRCWPSVATIASDAHISERTVQRSLRVLTGAGAIKIKTRVGRSAVYTLLPLARGDNIAAPDEVVTPESPHPVQICQPGGDTAVTQNKTNGTRNKKQDSTLDVATFGKSPAAETMRRTTTLASSEVLTAWNEMAQQAGLPLAREMTPKRCAALRAQMKNTDWVTHWREALARVGQSGFLRGRGGLGWKADLDWFLRPDTVTLILEGKYDDWVPASCQAPTEDDLLKWNPQNGGLARA
jgi:hypothetical protein